MMLVANSAGALETRGDLFAGDSNLPRLRLGDRRREFATSVNNRVTKGKRRGRHFAEWGKGEKQPAESMIWQPALAQNRARFRIARRKGEISGRRPDGFPPAQRPRFTDLGSLPCPS
jgi:hypothetical protein